MDFKKFLPHLISLAILLAVSCLYFFENSFGGKALPQYDNQQARGMQAELMHFKEIDGQVPQWTNSTFGGMPTYQIYAKPKGNFTEIFSKIIYLGQKFESLWAYVFGAMFCMYLFLVVLRLDWRVALFGALAYGITSYNMDILHAGHSTKMSALALAPGVLAGVVLVFSGRFLVGGGVLAFFTAMQVMANHFQITYYTILIIGIYFLVELFWAVRHQAMANWGLRLGTVAIALFLGFASNLSRLWPTYEFGSETIRGRSELKQKESKGDGLEKSYAQGYSYGIRESLTLIVPHAAGGGANESIQTGKFYEMMSRGRNAVEQKQLGHQIASAMYHGGGESGVGTAIYFGAIICFLFFLGTFLVRGPEHWWLFWSGIFAVIISWGGNFIFNDFLYSYFPMFNKFRAVSMALGIGQLCFAGLAALGLQKIFDEDISKDKKLRALGISAVIAATFCFLAMIFGGGTTPGDANLAAQIKMPNLPDILSDDRAAMARSDAFRSLAFILAAAAVLFFYIKGKLKSGVSVLLVAVLALADHWGVAKRGFSGDEFQDKKTATADPIATQVDKEILQDQDLHYRVLDVSKSLTGNGLTSFFHKSLSGYSAVKIQRYQEVIDSVYAKGGYDFGSMLNVLGMFNAKYLIARDKENRPQLVQNPQACGAAWFVKGIKIVDTPEEELASLRNLNTRDTALVQKSFSFPLENFKMQPDSTASIKIVKYHPDKMEYEYSAATDQLAVFPEIYYPAEKGWKFFLNGQPLEHKYLKVNYLLRGMVLPAGQNQKFEMRFEPKSYYLGEKVSMAASLLVLLIFFYGMWVWFKKHGIAPAANLSEIEEEIKTEKIVSPAKREPAPVKKQETRKKK